MSGEFNAAGGLATAGLVAGAIEGREPHEAGEGPCLNCGAPTSGRFCANCGQATHTERSLWHLFQEVLYGLFNFDTKAWRTLPLLIGRPGTLTRNYVYGKRASYVSPLALFLLCVFLMFFVFSFARQPDDMNLGSGSTRAELNTDLAEARADLAKAQREQAQARAHPDPDEPAGLEARLAQQQVDLAQVQVTRSQQALDRFDAAARAQAAAAAARQAQAQTGGVHFNASNDPTHTPGVSVTTSEPPRAGQRWQDQLSEKARNGTLNVDTGWPLLDQRIREKALNPDLALYKIGDAAYKYSFLLVPISLPFLAFLFLWKRGLTLYDHTVFLLYGLSFASLLFVATMAVIAIPFTRMLGVWLVGLGWPVHTFFHLKGAYKLGWWSALWRMFFLSVFALIALLIYMFVIVVLGLTE